MKRSHTVILQFLVFLFICLFVSNKIIKAQTNGWHLYNKINEVSQLVSDGNTLWIASAEGLVKLDKTSMNHTNYDVLNSDLPGSYVLSIVSDGTGGIWGGTYNGLFHFDGTNWQIYDQSNTAEIKFNQVNNVFRDSKGNIWITYAPSSPAAQNITMFDGTSWTNYNLVSMDVGNLYKITEDNSGNIVVGCYNGFLKYDGSTWSKVSSTTMGFASKEIVYKAIQDSKNNFWLATYDSGLVKYDGSNITSYTTSNSPVLYDVQQNIKIDANDNIYLLPGIYGFQKFDGTNWTTYNKTNDGLIGDAVTDLIFDGTKTWAGIAGGYGGLGGLDLYDGTSWSEVSVSNSGIPSNFISSVALRNINGTTETWVGTQDHGIASFDGTTWHTYNSSNSGLSNDGVNDIAVDRSGKIWIGTSVGLNVFDVASNTWTLYNSTNTGTNGMQSGGVKAIKIDTTGATDTIWVSNGYYTYSRLVKFDGTNWNYYRPSNGLSYSFTKIDIDQDHNVWLISNNAGVLRFDGISWAIWNTGNSKLQSNTINDLKATSLGVIAAVGYNGIAVFNPNNSDWVNYDNTNSPLNLDNVEIISEVPDTVKYTNSSAFSLKKLNSNGIAELIKFEEQLLFGGQYLDLNTNKEKSEAIDVLRGVRETANPLALATGLLFSDALSKGESDFISASIHYIQDKIKIALGTSMDGLAVNDNASIPQDISKKDNPKINSVIVNEVVLKHHNPDRGGMTKVDVTPGNKGAYLTLEGVESNGSNPNPNAKPQILEEDLYIPGHLDLSKAVSFGFREPEFLTDGKTALINAYISTVPTNGNLNINDLSAIYLATAGLENDNALGAAIKSNGLSITTPGPKPNLKPEGTINSITYNYNLPSLDLDYSSHPITANFAGDLNACVPTGAANSLMWLNDTNPDFQLPAGKTLRDVMEELSSMMNRADTDGVVDEDFIKGKLDFIEKYKLNLEVKFQSSFIQNAAIYSSSNMSYARNFVRASSNPTWNFLKQQVEDGEDVEIGYYWYTIDTNKTNNTIDTLWYGHCENVAALTEFANGYKELTIKSDIDQENPGGISAYNTKEVWLGNDGFLHFILYPDTVKLTTVVAESPLAKEGRATSAFINEIFANNGGTGNVATGTTVIPEFIEVAVDTNITDLSNYRVSLYDSTGKVYDVKTLDQFTKGSTQDSMAAYYYNYSGGIQNKGGVSLMYSGSPLQGQFVSYGNSFVADSGDATALQSDSIGVITSGNSLALSGSGIKYSDFTWGSSATPTPGDFNPGESIITAIENNQTVPLKYSLLQNYPNPFNPSTKIKYSLPENVHVKIKIYDILGRLVTTLINAQQKTGIHEINFDASRLASGVYFYQLITPNFVQTKKMLLLK